MTKRPTPAAALLTVDATDRQAQYLDLQLWVWVDLGIVQRKLVLRAFEDSFTVKGEGTRSRLHTTGRENPGPHLLNRAACFPHQTGS